MYIAMHAVAMGSKGVAMTAVFAVILLGLLIAGLFSYSHTRRRQGSSGPGGAGRGE
jgi:hypothetical protein